MHDCVNHMAPLVLVECRKNNERIRRKCTHTNKHLYTTNFQL